MSFPSCEGQEPARPEASNGPQAVDSADNPVRRESLATHVTQGSKPPKGPTWFSRRRAELRFGKSVQVQIPCTFPPDAASTLPLWQRADATPERPAWGRGAGWFLEQATPQPPSPPTKRAPLLCICRSTHEDGLHGDLQFEGQVLLSKPQVTSTSYPNSLLQSA